MWRVGAFIAIFLTVSGTLGPRIISNGLLSRYHFDVYGPAGKALLFGLVAFGILVKNKWGGFKLSTWERKNIFWLVIAALCYMVAAISVSQLENGSGGAFWPLVTHLTLLASILLTTIGTFGALNLKRAYTLFKDELGIALGSAVLFVIFLSAVYSLWKYLSTAVLHAVDALLDITGIHSVIVPPHTLVLDKFAIEIAQYCSGIESIALFTGLYAIVGLLDWERLNRKKFFTYFLPGLILLFALNIVRVYILVLAGYFINPHIAFSLFHTYAGMLFFIIYSAIFFKLTYARMLK